MPIWKNWSTRQMNGLFRAPVYGNGALRLKAKIPSTSPSMRHAGPSRQQTSIRATSISLCWRRPRRTKSFRPLRVCCRSVSIFTDVPPLMCRQYVPGLFMRSTWRTNLFAPRAPNARWWSGRKRFHASSIGMIAAPACYSATAVAL